jgi:hypothetical protein
MEVELVAIVLTPLNRPGSGERPGHNRHVVFGKYDMKRETSALSDSRAGENDPSGQWATP